MTNVRSLLVDTHEEPSLPDESDQTPALLFTTQVDDFYALPRPDYERTSIRFSPSKATSCERELYFAFTNAPTDQTSLVPWKQRLARNGTAVHSGFQRDIRRMPEALAQAGKSMAYEPIMFWNDEKQREENEHHGEKSYDVGGTIVTLRGKCDGLFRETSTGAVVGFEFKTKDKMRGLTKVNRFGVDLHHRAQTVAYSLIFGIDRWLVVYESLQKPDWSKDDADDMKAFHVVLTPEEKRALLVRLARIVRAVENKTVPPGDFTKCAFCPYKGVCAEHESKEAV